MNFIPLLCVPIVFLGLSSCGDDGAAAALERERDRVELTHRLELAVYRLEQNRGVEEAARQYRQLRTAIELSAAQLDEARQQKARLEADVKAMGAELETYRARVVGDFRRRWIGETFAEFDTASGRVFREATVVSISDIGVTLRHRDGSARLGYADLTDDQRRQFALESDTARSAEEKEHERLLAYERELDRQFAAQLVRDREELRQRPEPPRIAASSPRRTSGSPAGESALFASASPLSQPARALGDGRRSYRVRNRSNSNYYYVLPSCRTYSSVQTLTGSSRRSSYVAPSCGSSRYTWLNPFTP